MTTESSTVYFFSIRMRFERFCRSIPFALGYRLHCPNGLLESADAKTEQSESRARPRELSVSPNNGPEFSKFASQNLRSFISNLSHVYSLSYGGPLSAGDLTTKAFCVKLALAKGEC